MRMLESDSDEGTRVMEDRVRKGRRREIGSSIKYGETGERLSHSYSLCSTFVPRTHLAAPLSSLLPALLSLLVPSLEPGTGLKLATAGRGSVPNDTDRCSSSLWCLSCESPLGVTSSPTLPGPSISQPKCG